MKRFDPSLLNCPIWLALILVGALALPSFAQSRLEQFRSLNGPMKRWVLAHPFAASFGQQVSARSLAITDSVGSAGMLGTDYNGGQLDAFRHGLWMALLVQRWSPAKAASLGRAYERGNRQDFKRGKLEDGGMQDAIAQEMDLYNNAVGRMIGRQLRRRGEHELIWAVAKSVLAGDFCWIRKNAAGQSLDAAGHVIDPKEWQGHWENRRRLEYGNQPEGGEQGK